MLDSEDNDNLNLKIQEIMEELKKANAKLYEIETKQKLIEQKINVIQQSVSGIENDIYEDSFDFDIVCPYCNTNFVSDVTSKSSIKCPECNNIIELDWNDDSNYNGCSGSCSSCQNNCGESWFQEIEEYDDNDENC